METMTSTKFAPLIFCIVLFFAASAYADPVDPCTVVPCSGGVTALDVTADGGDLSFTWNVERVAQGYKYTYTITTIGGGSVIAGLSHWSLEVTDGVTKDDLINPTGPYGKLENSDPFFGPLVDAMIKFDETTGSENGAVFMFILPNSPVLGSASFKGGSLTGGAADKSYEFVLENIVRPNGPPPSVPEPMTLFLLGTGILGVGLLRSRK